MQSYVSVCCLALNSVFWMVVMVLGGLYCILGCCYGMAYRFFFWRGGGLVIKRSVARVLSVVFRLL